MPYKNKCSIILSMRIACLLIPQFFLQTETIRRGVREGLIVVTGDDGQGAGRVLDCSREVSAMGVRPGQQVQEAFRLCPEALFTEGDWNLSRSLWHRATDALRFFTSRIEADCPGTAYLDITRAGRFYGGEEQIALAIRERVFESTGLRGKTGVGNGRFVAAAGAWGDFGDICVVPPGKEKAFLSPVPVAGLPLGDDVKKELAFLGLATLGKIAAIPKGSFVTRFGKGGRDIWSMANGEEDRCPVRSLPPCPEVRKEAVSEVPLEGRDQVCALVRSAVDETMRELEETGQGCRMASLSLCLHDGRSVERRFVVRSSGTAKEDLLLRMGAWLESLVLPAPVVRSVVSVPETFPERQDQGSLFTKQFRHTEAMRFIRGFLKAKYGAMPLVRAEEDDPHSPLPERRFLFREA